MNLFDILMITILAYGLIRGIFRGSVSEAASLIGVLGGFYAAYTYYPRLSKPLSIWMDSPAYQNIASFAIIFAAVLIVVNLLAMVIKYLMRITHLGWVDRVSGALFGLLKGSLVVCVAFIVLTTFLPQKQSNFIREATLSPYVATVSETMIVMASDSMRKRFVSQVKELKKSWQKR